MTADLTDLERAHWAALCAGDTQLAIRLEAQIDAADRADRARLHAPDALAGAALWYAHQGIPVFPCQPGGKAPATTHGLHDATTDEAQVITWWQATPQANIGLPTGHRFDVVDIDGPVGYLNADQVDIAGVRATAIGIALTPRGHHFYIPAVPGAANKVGIAPGVDYRATGGYVVAPPSRVGDRDYYWVTPLQLAVR